MIDIDSPDTEIVNEQRLLANAPLEEVVEDKSPIEQFVFAAVELAKNPAGRLIMAACGVRFFGAIATRVYMPTFFERVYPESIADFSG